MRTKIDNIEQLKVMAKELGTVEAYIVLNGGFRSSKDIQYDGREWHILHGIDDVYETFDSDEKMLTQTNIGAAFNSGALFAY